MSKSVVDPNWPRLLGLSVHELRTPLSVVIGYLRMLDRAGPLNEQQRSLIDLVMKSCGRLGDVIGEMSDLSQIEEGKVTLNRSHIDVRAVLAQAVSALPELPDREMHVSLGTGEGPAMLDGDPVRLKTAFTSLLTGLRREVVTTNEFCVREQVRRSNGRAESWITFGPPELVPALQSSDPNDLTTFNEWRGGCGLSLAIARRVIEAHSGHVWERMPDPEPERTETDRATPLDEDVTGLAPLKVRKTAAVVMLPLV